MTSVLGSRLIDRSNEANAIDLDEIAREVLDQVRYVVLGSVDPDGRARVLPVYFTAHPDTHHAARAREPAVDQALSEGYRSR